MCGIFGYVGFRNPVEMALRGLKQLEYRGYDSAGIGGLHQGKIAFCKEVGHVEALVKEVKESHLTLDLAIAQSRWATHGVPSRLNAHPHFDSEMTLALVHNGIIENYLSLRSALQEKGISFVSDTDTEVIAQLIASFYKEEKDILKAIRHTLLILQGAYAIALVHRDYPERIFATAHQSPLVLGVGSKEVFLASDFNAFAPFTQNVVFLVNSEIAMIEADHLEFFDSSMKTIDKEIEVLAEKSQEISKKGFDHFTLKEIYEQPQVIHNALQSRLLIEYGTATFEEWNFDLQELTSIERILILACGTSWHAGYLAAYMIEDRARIPVQVEISSEFRYKNPIVPDGTLVIAISQSGETADTIAAIRELKAKGVKILAICNVPTSTLVREAHSSLFLRAGTEVGVCSTKAYTSQIVVLALFTLLMARMRHMSKQEGQEFIIALQQLPVQVQKILDRADMIKAIAKKYACYDNVFFIGRQYMFPTSLEGALKLKEISYINANGYPAGEMKHGPIALITPECPTVALCANKQTFEKLRSNLMEVKARNGLILAIAEEGQILEGIADDLITVPSTIDELAGILSAVVTQLLAYEIARERGANIDQPRNLAKSVTVE